MSRHPFLASLLAASLAAPAACGIFDNQFPDLSITPPQESKMKESGLSAGSGGAADVDAPPPYVAPGASTQKNIQVNQQAAANDSTGEGEEKGKPEVPQLPSGGQGKGEQGGKDGGAPKGGGGGGCQSSQKALQDKIDAAKAKLAGVNDNDPHVKALLQQAQDSIAKAEQAKGDLDAVNKALKEAHDSLDKAADQIKKQNTQNEKDLKPLETAQPKRDALVKALDENTPDCTGTEMKETYGNPSPSAGSGADGDISGAESKSSNASRKLGGISRLIAFIGTAATNLGLTEAKADSKLNAKDGNTTKDVVSGLKEGVSDSKEDSDDALGKARTAKKETQEAQKQSQQVAQKLATTTTDAKTADESANEACKKLKELKPKYKAAEKKAQSSDPPTAAEGVKEMAKIKTEAATVKEKAVADNKKVEPEIKPLRTAHDKAVKQLDTTARDAIKELKTQLEK